MWPIAAFAVFVFSKTTNGGFALHALLGINIPLAVLAVQGWGTVTAGVAWMRRPALAWFVVAALVVPALAVQLRWASQNISASAQAPPPRGHGDAKFISDNERHALNYLERFRGPGGVLTRGYLGTIVPGTTGRPTYVGDSYWSPDFSSRLAKTDELFLGGMSADVARAFVRKTGARFILLDCSSRQDIDQVLAALIAAAHRFGCAGVYVLK